MGVDVGSPALHEIPTTSVVSSSGQARKSCEGGHLSHEEGIIYSRGAVFTPQGAGHDVGRPDSLRHNMVAGVDVTRLDISPNPAPMAAQLNLEVRPQPRVGPNRPRRTLRNPLTSSSVNYRSQVDFKLSEPIEGACWKVKYTVDITEMKFVVEVRPRTTRPSPLEVSTDPAGVPSACFHSRVLRE